VKAIDTNIVARIILQDDPIQFQKASEFCAGGVIIPLSVSLELEWVLRSRYRMPREAIVASFRALFSAAHFNFDNEAGMIWAIERYASGADFADMVHLLMAASADTFVTFDQSLVRDAGDHPPLSVEPI
jgi:predicted nucleic-acid-binding protein